MIVYRISKSKFAEDLSGTGAALFAARWNSVGTYMLYTSESSALSILENMVHYDLNELPNDLKLIRIIIPENIPLLELEIKNLPNHWNYPMLIKETQLFGDKLMIDKKYLAIRIPSVIAPYEYNILFNPRHEHFKKIKIESVIPFTIDKRFSGK